MSAISPTDPKRSWFRTPLPRRRPCRGLFDILLPEPCFWLVRYQAVANHVVWGGAGLDEHGSSGHSGLALAARRPRCTPAVGEDGVYR